MYRDHTHDECLDGRRARGAGPHAEARHHHGSGPGGRGHSEGWAGGHGEGCGRHHHRGHGFGPGGRARRGNVRAAVLTVLTERPMHGYEIMQELESRSGGMWRPSPGSVYPALQMLEDQGLVLSEQTEGKRVFALTEAGRAEAAKLKEEADAAPWEPGSSGGPHFKVRQAMAQVHAAAKQVAMSGSTAQVEEALVILTDARKRLYRLLADAD